MNERKTQLEKNGVEVDRIYAAVVVDADPMTEAEEQGWLRIIANSVGATSIDDVSIVASPALLVNENIEEDNALVAVNSSRDTLIAIIIILGALLLILLVLAFVLSGSKKKRRISQQREAIVQAAAGAQIGRASFDSKDLEQSDTSRADALEEAQIAIQSLSDKDGETKEAILKREIKEFTKTNPEIVAQLIRNWMKQEE